MTDEDKKKEEKKLPPTSVRLEGEHAAILEEILAVYSPPGVALSFSDGVKIALTFWKERYGKV